MPSGDRARIRNTVAQILSEALPGKHIFTTRSRDAREVSEYIEVFMANGAVEHDGLSSNVEGRLIIGVNKKGRATDDELDIDGDEIERVMGMTDFNPKNSGDTLRGLVSGVVYAGFDYPINEDSTVKTLHLLYAVIYPNP